MTNHKINNTYTSPRMVRRIKSFSNELIQKPLVSQLPLQHLKSPSKNHNFQTIPSHRHFIKHLKCFPKSNDIISLFFPCNPLANIPKFQFTFRTYSIHYKIEEQYRIQNTHSYALLPYKFNMHPRTFTSFFMAEYTHMFHACTKNHPLSNFPNIKLFPT